MNRQSPLLLLLLTLLTLVPQAAQAQLPTPGRNAIAARLVAESGRPAAGQAVTLALVMTPEPGWHGYWENPGDSGIETEIDWTLPAGAQAAPIRYPVPERLIVAGLMNYVYAVEYAQLIDLKLPAGLAPGTRLPLRAKVDYLACTNEICVPETATLALDIEIGDGAPTKRADFDRYRAAMPRPLGSPARFEAAGGKLRLAIPLPAAMAVAEPYFFPLTDGAIDYSAEQRVTRNGNMLVVETQAGAAAPAAIEGVLKIGEHQGLALTARAGDVPAAGTAVGAAADEASGGTTFAVALLGAIVGGLLLNIMPCVFPILSLKALSLAKVNASETAARREALAYTAGVVMLCLALGGGLLALRAGGAAVGWAFQLQDPRVILLLLLLVTAIALNLAGLFELPSLGFGSRLAGSNGAMGAFWTGALAAFVATPCTGPFMGAALGAALVLPTPAALAVFAGLGFGIALPFLALGFVPALRRRLPRPGPWMDRLRRLLSLPMFLTALGLAWILGRQAGVDGMTLGLAAALALALALWWVGRRQGGGGAWLPLAPALAAGVAAIMFIPATGAPAEAKAAGLLPSEPFSEARLAALQAEQRPVFAYFTADWCLTCKVNERAAIERQEVADAFAAGKVAVLVGDWTRGDPAIGRFLERHGRSGVPLYVYYAPGRAPQILPQVLTPGHLTRLVS